MVGDAGPGVMPGLVLWRGAQGVRRMKKSAASVLNVGFVRGGAKERVRNGVIVQTNKGSIAPQTG